MPKKKADNRGSGRPPMAALKRKSHFLTMRFTAAELAAMESKSGAASIREWARTVLLREAGR